MSYLDKVDILTMPSIPSGTNLIGKTSIDQTVDATTNRVVAKISQVASENTITIASGQNVGVVAGSAIIGKTSSDNTTDGTTNRVVSKISQTVGENIVSIVDPLPVGTNALGSVSVTTSALPTGAATSANQDILNAKDYATQTTLASLLAKVISAPATEANQATLNAKDFATQTTLASILAKIIASPATETTLTSIAGYVDGLEALLTAIKDTDGIKKITDALPTGSNLIGKFGIDQTTPGTTNGIVVNSSALPTGSATSANQTTLNSKDFATEATLASLLAKVIVSPSTESKQDTLIAKDFSTETTLSALLAKVIASPATEATLASILAKNNSCSVH